MIGLIGLVLSLLLLMTLAYRGASVIVLAPVFAMFAVAFSGELPFLATYTQIFMPALGKFIAKFFPLFLLGAVFGKLMEDSGCAESIARRIAPRWAVGMRFWRLCCMSRCSPTAASRCSWWRSRFFRWPAPCFVPRISPAV